MGSYRIFFITVISAVILLSDVLDARAWAGLGHNTATEVAQKYLTPEVRKKVEAYLDGQSIVECSEWMDKVRKTEEYGYTTNWHVNYFDRTGKAVIAEKHGKYNGDALYGLQYIMPILEDYKEYDDSTVAVNLKFVIHLIVDMHCPGHHSYSGLHVSSVRFYGKDVKFHAVWDGFLISRAHDFTPSEYAEYVDRIYKKERKKVCKGTILEWAESSAADCREIYDGVSEGCELGDKYTEAHLALAERQLAIAGYRLASLLNTIFG